MKTQIIQLETHDDLVSVRDRMSWAKTPRILLVWPRGGKAALRPIDLTLLQRHAGSLGAQLGLVTTSEEIRDDAQKLDIPVFETTAEAQRVPWPVPHRRLKPHRSIRPADLKALRAKARLGEAVWRSHPAARLVFFAFGVLAVLILVALLIPGATITLTPISRMQTAILPVTANPAISTVFLSGSLPARKTNVTIAGSQSAIATGQMTIPEQESQGEAHFRNLTQSVMTIPVGTVIRSLGSSPVRFITLQEGKMAAGVGQVVDLPIQSFEAGAAGNLPADSLQVIEGSLGLSLAVTNPEPTSGGRDRYITAPSQVDRERVRQALLATLRYNAQMELKSTLAPGDLVFPDTLIIVRIIEEAFDPPEGQPGRTLTLSMRLECSASYASAADLEQYANATLDASLPEGFVPAPRSLLFKSLYSPVTDSDGTTRWQMQVERRLFQWIDLAQVSHLVQGRSPKAARRRLESALPLSSPPQITLKPSWWPWLPLAPLRIAVVVQ